MKWNFLKILVEPELGQILQRGSKKQLGVVYLLHNYVIPIVMISINRI